MENFYGYKRVSTPKQDILRQTSAIEEWQTSTGVVIPKENFFTDYYTGTTFNRPAYQELKSKLLKGDYLIVKEIDRLGRDWGGIKDEWKDLKDKGINIIIIDVPILSDPLPWEKSPIEGLDLRLIKEQILSLMCYSAQKEREKISQRTKEALAKKRVQGIKLGRPRGEGVNKQAFISVLDRLIGFRVSQDRACYDLHYPVATFKRELKAYYEKFNTKDYTIIRDRLEGINEN